MATEKRLIDANALKTCLCKCCNILHSEEPCEPRECNVMAFVDVQPTVDAVEVAEYDAIVDKLECLLCHATGGKFSNAGYSFQDMERMVTDYIEECCEEAVAEEVVHGMWEPHPHAYGFVRCSVCHDCCIWNEWADGKKWNYCPNCGAKMDGDGNV